MTPKDVSGLLAASGYVPDESLATLVWMATALERPMLLEGEAGVGKTAIANALSIALDRPLFRLQCHESLDLNQAVYEWNYSKQLLEIRLREAEKGVGESLRQDLFSEAFLLKRPLMQAITSDKPAVLLIDEIDRADESFEAYLLEVLGEYQISVPEFGTVTAISKLVPPRAKGKLYWEIRNSGSRHTNVRYAAPITVMRVRMRSRYSAVAWPGRMPGIKPFDLRRLSAVSSGLKTIAV